MDMVQHKIKEILTKELNTCRNTWLITVRELQEVLISMAGDLAIEERHLTKHALDAGCTHAYSHDSQPADYKFCPWCGGEHHPRQ